MIVQRIRQRNTKLQTNMVNAKHAMVTIMASGARKSVRRTVAQAKRVFALGVGSVMHARQAIMAGSVIKSAQRIAQTVCLMTT
jgi:hypothetical protein